MTSVKACCVLPLKCFQGKNSAIFVLLQDAKILTGDTDNSEPELQTWGLFSYEKPQAMYFTVVSVTLTWTLRLEVMTQSLFCFD